MFNLQGKFHALGLFCRKPWNLFTKLISVFRNCDSANILIDYPINTETRIKLTVFVGCCLFDQDAAKPGLILVLWIKQKLFQLRPTLLCESANGRMIIRRLITKLSQQILIIDTIIS